MPGASWALSVEGGRCQANVVGGVSVGARPASNASANTLGGYTDVLTSGFASDVDGLWVQLQAIGVSVTAYDALVDLAIGAGGSEKVILSQMVACNGGVQSAYGSYVYWPVPIKAGVRVSARLQDTSGANSVDVSVIGVSQGFVAPTTASAVVTYGASASTSKATSVDPGASANTKGSWTQIVASTTQAHRWLTVGVGNLANAGQSASTTLIDIGVGGSGSEQVLIPNIYCRSFAASTGIGTIGPNLVGPFACEIPSGTRLSARAQNSGTDATDRVCGVVLYGIS